MKKIIISSFLIFLSLHAFSQQPLYRYYNRKYQKHYYTVDFNEFGNGGKGWAFEGTACMVLNGDDRLRQKGIVPVFRYLNTQNGDHYYTIHRDILGDGAQGDRLEGPVFYIFERGAEGTRPLFEYYNRRNGDHFYTVDKSELGRGFEGYEFTTIVGFVFVR